MKYKYMVAYRFVGIDPKKEGLGRVFITMEKPLTSEEMILKVEDYIKKDSGFEKVFLLNIVKLKK